MASTWTSSPALQAPSNTTRPAPRTRRAANQCAAHGATREVSSCSSGEEIDLDGIRPDSGDEEVPPSDRAEPAPGSLEPSPAPSVGSGQVGTLKTDLCAAKDVWHFFKHGYEKENTEHQCLTCGWVLFLTIFSNFNSCLTQIDLFTSHFKYATPCSS